MPSICCNGELSTLLHYKIWFHHITGVMLKEDSCFSRALQSFTAVPHLLTSWLPVAWLCSGVLLPKIQNWLMVGWHNVLIIVVPFIPFWTLSHGISLVAGLQRSLSAVYGDSSRFVLFLSLHLSPSCQCVGTPAGWLSAFIACTVLGFIWTAFTGSLIISIRFCTERPRQIGQFNIKGYCSWNRRHRENGPALQIICLVS